MWNAVIDMQLGTWADWFSAIGTIGAVITSLFFALRKPKAKLKFLIQDRYASSTKIDHFSLEAINLGNKSVELKAWRNKDHSELDDLVSFSNNQIKVEPGVVPNEALLKIRLSDKVEAFSGQTIWVFDKGNGVRYDIQIIMKNKKWFVYKIKKVNLIRLMKKRYKVK